MKRKKMMERNKLTPRYIGPFEIIKINDNAMRLALPSSMKIIHNVFNVDRLLKHHASPDKFIERTLPKKYPVILDNQTGEELYIIEVLLKQK